MSEDKDAIFGLPPHEVVAKNPLHENPHQDGSDVKSMGRTRRHRSTSTASEKEPSKKLCQLSRSTGRMSNITVEVP
jgi:hypothetical protein